MFYHVSASSLTIFFKAELKWFIFTVIFCSSSTFISVLVKTFCFCWFYWFRTFDCVVWVMYDLCSSSFTILLVTMFWRQWLCSFSSVTGLVSVSSTLLTVYACVHISSLGAVTFMLIWREHVFLQCRTELDGFSLKTKWCSDKSLTQLVSERLWSGWMSRWRRVLCLWEWNSRNKMPLNFSTAWCSLITSCSRTGISFRLSPAHWRPQEQHWQATACDTSCSAVPYIVSKSRQ